MTLLATQQISIAGLNPTMSAANAGGDTVVADDRTFLRVKNGSGSPVTVTVTTPGTVSGLAIADATMSVPATTGDMMLGPLPASLFGDPVSISYSAVTSVTVAALRV